ncbi:MAG TPA: response regulator transcription factor [Streptosporangiaceae bacterium]|nr:response regulator transcription factor [Streptosporangiaceae bacterium]
MITVAIVDDHPLYRQGLAMAIEQADDLELVGDATSVEHFDRLDVTPDVVLLDLHLPGIQGAEGVAHVCARGTKVIVVSAAGAADDVIDAVAAGAAGYLTKDAEADDIRRAVRAVAGGQTYVSPTLASYLINANRKRAMSLEHRLSPRELEILALVAAGETDRDIAKQLFIATATVYSHLERIRDKTGARRRAQLTRLYLENKKP